MLLTCKVVMFLPKRTLREKCPNTEFFLVRIFPYFDRIRGNTDQKNLRIWTLFTQWEANSSSVLSGVIGSEAGQVRLIPNNIIKFDYKCPKWMNPKIISSLRNRSKLTKSYYSNPTE